MCHWFWKRYICTVLCYNEPHINPKLGFKWNQYKVENTKYVTYCAYMARKNQKFKRHLSYITAINITLDKSLKELKLTQE